MDPRLIKDVKNAEGCNLRAYKDSLGYWTIGYGHLLPDQEKNWADYEITADEAEQFLISDLAGAETSCTYLPEWKYLDTDCRKNAVMELYFNLGSKWKLFAQTRLDIQNGNWQKAHDDLLHSLWAKQVGVNRSTRLAGYLLTGQYPA